MSQSTEDKIRQQIAENPIIIYMKGTPENPECGFSAAAIKSLNTTGKAFAFVNVLQSPFIREKLPKVSDWPTFPQLFVGGELVGGSDIICAMIDDGSLQPLMDAAETASA